MVLRRAQQQQQHVDLTLLVFERTAEEHGNSDAAAAKMQKEEGNRVRLRNLKTEIEIDWVLREKKLAYPKDQGGRPEAWVSPVVEDGLDCLCFDRR